MKEHTDELARMASYLSHEIKNPLASVDIQLQLLHEWIQESIPEKFRDKLIDYVRIISREIQRLQKVADEFADFSNSVKINVQPCSLKTEIEKFLALVRPSAQEKHVEIELAVPGDLPVIACDPAQLHQVFFNLLANAFHAMPNGGKVRISVERNSRELLCRIADTGTGISPEEQERIFEPFYTLRENGSGLGLSIARRIVETHGGKIFVEKSSLQGTTISFTIPVEKSFANSE